MKNLAERINAVDKRLKKAEARHNHWIASHNETDPIQPSRIYRKFGRMVSRLGHGPYPTQADKTLLAFNTAGTWERITHSTGSQFELTDQMRGQQLEGRMDGVTHYYPRTALPVFAEDIHAMLKARGFMNFKAAVVPEIEVEAGENDNGRFLNVAIYMGPEEWRQPDARWVFGQERFEGMEPIEQALILVLPGAIEEQRMHHAIAMQQMYASTQAAQQ